LQDRELAMRSLALAMRKFLRSEDGPTAVEYAVMLALIVVACLTAISALGTATNATFGNVSNSLAAL
jgi:pilus assembly protein Flp/PilA